MLYHLSDFLTINLLHYITVRAGLAFLIAFFLTVYLIPRFIRWATRQQVAQPIHPLVPKTHQRKTNTPTMGGIVFMIATLVGVLLCAKLNNAFVLGGLLCIVAFGGIGMRDDLKKINLGTNEAGLRAGQKIFLQLVCAVGLALFLVSQTQLDYNLYVPFYKHPILDLSWSILILWTLVLIASSNAVNLTDGLDGLATVPCIFSLFTLSIFLYIAGHAVFSSYLLFPKVNGVGEVVIIGAASVGALIGFLWYNCYPAQIFMGDSGSLSMGALIGYMAIISKNEILLLLIGFVFVVETISVILQISSVKTRQKRLFLMAPIHHHFEIKGWSENKIIVRFWIIALLSNILALIALKVR